MREIRQSKSYAEYMKSEGWIIEKINSDFVFIKKVKFFGSLMKYQRPEKADLKKLSNLARQYRSFYIVCELKTKSDFKKFKNNNFKIINPYLPSKTLIVDLEKSKDEIYNSFTKSARYSIRKSENKKVKEEADVHKFNNSWKNAAARGRYILTPTQLKSYKNAFSKNMILLTNKKGDSGAMFLVADSVGYYWYGFTSDSARATDIQYKIIFEGMLWVKSMGAKKFDFEGIQDERFPIKGWDGFSRFKKKFGGEELEYPPALGKWDFKNILKK